jgi:hypothetical protein
MAENANVDLRHALLKQTHLTSHHDQGLMVCKEASSDYFHSWKYACVCHIELRRKLPKDMTMLPKDVP